MSYLKQAAIGVLFVELVLAAVLLVGLLVPLPGSVSLKIVQSGSMEPAVPVGSMIAIMPTERYVVGDVITFGDDSGKRVPTTHRIVGTEREAGSIRYVTKGDANEERDRETVAHTAVLGQVVAHVPRLGYVLDFARTREGFTFMIVVPAALVVLDELFAVYGVMRQRKPAQKRADGPRAVVQPVWQTSGNMRVSARTGPGFSNCLDLRAL
jgi:signal peptidase